MKEVAMGDKPIKMTLPHIGETFLSVSLWASCGPTDLQYWNPVSLKAPEWLIWLCGIFLHIVMWLAWQTAHSSALESKRSAKVEEGQAPYTSLLESYLVVNVPCWLSWFYGRPLKGCQLEIAGMISQTVILVAFLFWLLGKSLGFPDRPLKFIWACILLVGPLIAYYGARGIIMIVRRYGKRREKGQ